MRILVTGSRTWDNRATIESALLVALDYLPPWDAADPPVLVHGAADGADTIAGEYWEAFGLPTEPHPANWKRYGRKRAGHIRNAHMVNLGADLCLAFIRNNSPGATGCVTLAKKAGIPTTIYRETTIAA